MSQTTTCRTCGASLAPDQRYCLSCGTRVSSQRLDFIAEYEQANGAAQSNGQAAGAGAGTAGGPAALLNGAAANGAAPAATTPAPAVTAVGGSSRLDRVGGPMGAAAVVLVALGIGFLIGQSGEDNTPVATRAPVVNIQGGLPSAAPATTTPSASPDASASGDTSADGASSDAGSSDTRSGAQSRRAAADYARRVADSIRDIPKTDTSTAGGDLNRLRAQPDETATEGPPPPRDDRAPGGGSEGVTIG